MQLMAFVRKLWIEGAAGRLECALRVARPARAAAVLAHPHPSHGGTLHNPVIFHADRALWNAGFSTLRFNFRGVGTSEGRHDEGRGEVDDVGHAVRWLRGIVSGLPMVLVGYSFGVRCSLLHMLRDPDVTALVAIGLPLRSYPFTELVKLHRPYAVVQGGADELGPLEELRSLLDGATPEAPLYVVDGASHLFPGAAPQAARCVVEAATHLLPAADSP